MEQSQRRISQHDNGAPARHGKYRLDKLDAARMARHLVIFQPTFPDVERLLAKARPSIPGMAETEEVLKVLRYNPNCLLAVARKSGFDSKAPVGEGFYAMLPLNPLGLQVLALGAFNATSPDLRLIAGPTERPAALYMWAVFAPGTLAAGIALFMEKMAAPQYAGVDLYSRANTEAGRKYHQVLGLDEGSTVGTLVAPHLWFFPRRPEAPPYDTYVPGAGKKAVGITVARNFEDLNRVVAVRAAVYIGEQECPYDEEFDGNDLAATHLLAYIGDEPAGCLRVRFFADFAKLERLVIRKEFRKSRAAFQLVNAGLKLCQKKGYRRAYGHSQTRLVNFWGRFGFHTFEGGQSFVFSDFDYVELVTEIEPDPEAVKIGVNPYVIIRPEGRWHMPGILEQSAARAATSPSVSKKS